MGAGKTTVGRALARSLDKPFYDTDHEIEKKTGVKVPVIFELEGEDGFRRREVQAIEELTQAQSIVLATGGGAVINAENRLHLKERGLVIYLRASVHELWIRTRNDKNRPLLQQGDPKLKLQTLFNARDPLYREVADYVVDTGGQSVNAILHHIEDLIQQSPNESQ